jgi:hypothetical protein
MRTTIGSIIWSAAIAMTTACSPPAEDAPIEQAATAPPDPTMPAPNPCGYQLTGAPDKLITMGLNITSKIETLTINTPVPPFTYPPPQCPAWKFDVVLPHNATPNPNDCGSNGCYPWAEINAGATQFSGSTTVDGGFSVPSNAGGETHCESFKNWMALYKKAAGASAFVLVKTINYRGHWLNNACVVKAGLNEYYPNDLAAPLPPASGTDTYRILTTAIVDGSYRSLRVKVDYEKM